MTISAFFSKTGLFLLSRIAKVPFGTLCFLSDILYYIVYHLTGYRKKVILENLKHSFPEKNSREIRNISKKFYRHLCDLIFETIKMKAMHEQDFRERMVFQETELLNRYFREGRSVIVLTMHYNNWEWSSAMPLFVKHEILGVYKPLHNPVFDQYLNQMREKMGSCLVQNAKILRVLLEKKEKGEPVLTWLAADQTPPEFHKFWMRFLNQETMFYPGPAYLSKRFNFPLFFQKIEKTGRGRYTSVFELLFENPRDKSEKEIMEAYIKKMEEVIKEKPEYYLWSHKRWKHQPPDKISLQDK